MENPGELCTFSSLLTQWNSGCSLPEAGASQMSHRFLHLLSPPLLLASCCLTLPFFCFCAFRSISEIFILPPYRQRLAMV